jgi:hypothetical protein
VSGHVFHPGHHALHGVTVLLETRGNHAYIGRLDTEDEAGIHLLDVAVHDPQGSGLSKEEFVRHTLKFGVRVDRKHAVVPSAEVAAVKPLSEVALNR